MSLFVFPEDIIGVIFSFLSIPDLPSLHLTSKRASHLLFSLYRTTLEDPSIDLIPYIRSHYPRITIIHSKKRCMNPDCKSESELGEILCKGCIETYCYRVSLYESPLSLTIYVVNTFAFIRDKRGYPNCCGFMVGCNAIGSNFDSIAKSKVFGYNSVTVGENYVNIRPKTCNRYHILHEKPFIVRKCTTPITYYTFTTTGLTICPPCSYISDPDLTGAIKVRHFFDKAYTIIDHKELKGHIKVDLGTMKVISIVVQEEFQEKYGIKNGSILNSPE